MKKGRVKITNHLIAEALGFPPDWIIEEISNVQKFEQQSEMLISGNSFPETNNRGDAEDCTLIVHEKQRTFEVTKKD